jgi:hypothetical protein
VDTLGLGALEVTKMCAYVEVVNDVILTRYELNDGDLRDIGKFTRENIAVVAIKP